MKAKIALATVSGKAYYKLVKELKRREDYSIRSSEFIKIKKIGSETLKRHQDTLEEMGLIEVEVLRNVTGRPNKIKLTKKGDNFIIKLIELQKVLNN